MIQTASVQPRVFNSSRPAFLDACAAVMLVLEERGLEHARVNLLKCFNPAGSFFITSFCFFEALGVLKRKMLKRQIVYDHYVKCCYMLLNYRETSRFRLHEPKISTFQPFRSAKTLGEKYSVDLSDALQIVDLAHGEFSHYVQDSKPLLITVDGDLEKAARTEGLRVWNCKDAKTPPEQ